MLYPVNLDISGRRCLVVGGGRVAVRKVSALLFSGAVIRVVSPECLPKIRRLAEDGRIEWLQRTFVDEDLDGNFLVFAATDAPDVQRRIAGLAKDQGILVNSAELPGLSSFQVPARIRREGFLLTVSTGGASPALSSIIKRNLALEYGPEYGRLVTLMAAIRRFVVGGGSSQEDNRALFHDILERPVLPLIRERDWDGLQRALQQVLPDGIDCAALVGQISNDEDGLTDAR